MENNNNKIFADAFRKAFIEDRGLTQAALTRLLQLPPSTVHNWLSGRALPRPRLFGELNNQLEGGWPTEVLEAYNSLQKPKAAPKPEPQPVTTLVVKLVEETPATSAEPAAATESAVTPAAPAGKRSYGRRKIGPWLLQARELANKSQAEVAAYAGVASSTISRWEHDKWAPSQEQLTKLKELLGVDFDTRPLQSGYPPEAQADAADAKEAVIKPPRRPRLETLLRSCQQTEPNSEIKLNQQALRNLVEVCHGVAQLEERKAALISQLLEPEKKLTARERLIHLADPQEGPLRSIGAESGIRSFGQILTTSLAGWSSDDKVGLTGLTLSRLTALEQGETPSAQESIKLLQDLGLEAEDMFPCGRFCWFSELLREILEEAQVSAQEFARVTGIDLSRIENWLSDETVPNKVEIGIISGGCGLSYNAVWNSVYRPDQPVWEKRREFKRGEQKW